MCPAERTSSPHTHCERIACPDASTKAAQPPLVLKSGSRPQLCHEPLETGFFPPLNVVLRKRLTRRVFHAPLEQRAQCIIRLSLAPFAGKIVVQLDGCELVG